MKSAAMEILLCLLAGFPVLKANDCTDKKSPFCYDWDSLRIGGLICAGILCFLGIIILLSGKCKCKPRRRSSSSMQVNMASKRALQGGTSEC